MKLREGNNMQAQRRMVRWLGSFIVAVGLLFGVFSAMTPAAQAASWMDPYLDKVVEWGVMRGDINGNLDAERSITRAEFVTMLNRAYGYKELGSVPFQDVKPQDWYYEDICIAYNAGYFTGTSATTASPDAPLTREQAAVLIGRNMMLQEGTGEALGFSDSRELSDWSRHLIQAVAQEGVITGYPDGGFHPKDYVTRGQVAAMLVRAIGTPVQEPGEHSLGGVYGNVTITSPGVTLKDTTIVGDLYISGGVGLSDVTLENVKVMGKIVVSGSGESEKGDHSVVLRNVEANELVVDSIADQFVTLKAEGLTNIDQVNVRTTSYLEDLTEDGLGLREIVLNGDPGAAFQLAGNIKDVVNLTPGSALTLAQGIAQTITVDETALSSTLSIDPKAMAGVVNLDTAATVLGNGDIDHLNVNAPRSSVSMLPDTITVRPGITADVNGETMDAAAAAESSEDPRLLAGYPAARNVAPKTADIVFKTNKKGTIYWAVTALADGTVEETDLISPPAYSGKIIKSGTLSVTASNTELTTKLSGLTVDGSYYVSAILVDNRGKRSPVKITAFTTPDDTVPAFASGYPYTVIADGDDEQIVQAMVMANKSCQMYYALLPKGSSAPTAADFKANAVTGNLGYGVVELQKNTPYLVSRVNNAYLQEVTSYDLYLWLTDADGAKSSAVKKLTVTTLDRTPPKLQHLTVTDVAAKSVSLTFALDEPGTLYWAVVKSGAQFYLSGVTEKTTEAMVQIESGVNALKNGSSKASKALTDVKLTISGLEPETAYDVYYVVKDTAGNYGVYTETIKLPYTINTLDNVPPTVEQEFTHDGSASGTLTPYPDTSIRLVFSENIQGMLDRDDDGESDCTNFLELYEQCKASGEMDELADVLRDYIKLNEKSTMKPVKERISDGSDDDWVIDYRNVKIEMDKSGTGELILTFPYNSSNPELSALNLSGGVTYYFTLEGIADTSTSANRMVGTRGVTTLKEFTTISAQIMLAKASATPDGIAGLTEFDMVFSAKPISHEAMDDDVLWDLVVWSDTMVSFDIYEKITGEVWERVGSESVEFGYPDGKQLGKSLGLTLGNGEFEPIKRMQERVYGIKIRSINGDTNDQNWNVPVTLQITAVTGDKIALRDMGEQLDNSYTYETAIENASSISDITTPSVFTVTRNFVDSTPPQFTDNYPTFDAGDSMVQIRVMLDRPNSYYYYIVAPVGSIPTKLSDGTPVTADNWNVLPESGEGTLVEVPTPTNSLIMTYKGSGSSIKSGKGTFDGVISTFAVNGLASKTKYIAYFVLQGEAQGSYSPYVYCFRFETGDVETPVITLRDRSPSVSVMTSTDANLTWILMESGKAVGMDILGQKFTGNLIAEEKRTEFNSKYGTSLSVIEALTTTVGDSETKSVFDEYAGSDIYNDVLSLVMETTGTTYYTDCGSMSTKAGATVTESPNGMSDPTRYYFIAVAQNPLGGKYGFKAIGDIHVVNANPPKVLSCSTEISRTYTFDGSAEADREDTFALPAAYSYSGTLTIQFDKVPYCISSATNNLPKALSSFKNLAGSVGYASLGITGVTANGQMLQITFEKAKLDSIITLFNPGVICDEYGTTQKDKNGNSQHLQMKLVPAPKLADGSNPSQPVVFEYEWI